MSQSIAINQWPVSLAVCETLLVDYNTTICLFYCENCFDLMILDLFFYLLRKLIQKF